MGLFKKLFGRKLAEESIASKSAEKETSFSQKGSTSPVKPDADTGKEWELPEWFLKEMIKKLLESTQTNLPQHGRIKPLKIAFEIIHTGNIGALEIESSASEERDIRVLKSTVVRKGTDYAYNHFLIKGNSDEIREYLRDSANFNEINDSLHELSDSVDKYWE